MKLDMRVQSLENEGKCLAKLSATLDDSFAIRGLRLMEGKNGLFVNFPSYKGRSGYVDICFPTTAELRQQMTDMAVAAYQQALEHHQGQGQKQSNGGQSQSSQEQAQSDGQSESAEPSQPKQRRQKASNGPTMQMG